MRDELEKYLKDPDVAEYVKDFTETELRVHKFNWLMAQGERADFTYWSKVPYWSHDEAVALLLGKDPGSVNLETIMQKDRERSLSIFIVMNYQKLKNLVLRACETNEIGTLNSPVDFLEWAESRSIEVPEALKQEVLAKKRHCIKSEAETEMENLLKIKDEEIATLQKRIEVLEALAWEGFDEKISTYAKELAIALKAHTAVSKQWKPGSSVKKQIFLWLKENYPKLFNEERERIAKICNWQKSGGSPLTP